MANGKRTAAPVKSSVASDKASKVPEQAARASIEGSERQHAGVIAAVRRGQRLRMQPVKGSAAVARD